MKKYLIWTFAFVSIALLAVSFVSAFGGVGFGSPFVSQEDKDLMKEQRDLIRQAIENEDYNSWASLMQERVNQMESQINEETFQALLERHSEMNNNREEGFGRYSEGFAMNKKGLGNGRGNGNSWENCPLMDE